MIFSRWFLFFVVFSAVGWLTPNFVLEVRLRKAVLVFKCIVLNIMMIGFRDSNLKLTF